MEHFNKLTPAEAERLALLAEECGEVIQSIGKILRHGYEGGNPNGSLTNRQKLQIELGDIGFVCKMMEDSGDINIDAVIEAEREKQARDNHYLHHNKVNA